jgi:hypothetical protein
MELLDTLQWPVMVITVIAAWFVASQKIQQELGFWLFL